MRLIDSWIFSGNQPARLGRAGRRRPCGRRRPACPPKTKSSNATAPCNRPAMRSSHMAPTSSRFHEHAPQLPRPAGGPCRARSVSLHQVRARRRRARRPIRWPRSWPKETRSTGSTPGFGKLAQTRIADEDLTDLQLNLLRSHAAGTGTALPAPIVRLILLLKIKSLSRGHSGIAPRHFDMLSSPCSMRTSCPPSRARDRSAHRAIWRRLPICPWCCSAKGKRARRQTRTQFRRRRALQKPGSSLWSPGPKEGLALLNGTQVSTAIALDDGLFGCGTQPVRRPARRRHVGRRDPRQRHAVRSRASMSCAAMRARPTPPASSAACSRAVQDPRLSCRLRAGPGPLLLPLPAAGHGRLPRSCATARPSS